MSAAKKSVRRARSAPSAFGYGDVPTSLLLIFPLFLAYEMGVIFSSSMNGVDFVSRWVFAAVGFDRVHYLLLHAGVGVLFVGLLIYLRRRRSLSFSVFPPMLLESSIYALTLGTFIVFVMQSILGMELAKTSELALSEVGNGVVISLGAGVHEELVFRLGLMGGGAALLSLAIDRRLAVAIALAVSAVLFSLAHHLGSLGEPFEVNVFTYRLLAGVAFGAIFYFRSLSHAVYTHFLYDLYVLVLR